MAVEDEWADLKYINQNAVSHFSGWQTGKI
jgi:hypothetical protein